MEWQTGRRDIPWAAFYDKGLVAKGVGEDDLAALLSQLVVASYTWPSGTFFLKFILHQAQGLAGFLGGVDEVEVIGEVLMWPG